jgi:hypothetical protein
VIKKVTAVSAAALPAVMLLLAGCGTSQKSMTLTLLNDSGGPVTVNECAGNKCVYPSASPLAPGSKMTIQVRTVGASDVLNVSSVKWPAVRCLGLSKKPVASTNTDLRVSDIPPCHLVLTLSPDPSP